MYYSSIRKWKNHFKIVLVYWINYTITHVRLCLMNGLTLNQKKLKIVAKKKAANRNRLAKRRNSPYLFSSLLKIILYLTSNNVFFSS